MRNLNLLLLPVLALMAIVPASAHAAISVRSGADVWIVSASGTIATYDTQSVTGGSVSALNIGAGVGHSIGSRFEAIVFGAYLSTSAGTATTSLLEVVGQVNAVLMGNHANALYVGARGGIQSITSAGTSTSAQLFGGAVGKRFQLMGPLSYDPNFAIMFTQDTSGTSSPKLHFVPIQLTLTF